MPNSTEFNWSGWRRSVFWLAAATTALTFVLLLSGGQVTSYDVGMAVPDWPTTFGQNMFTFPWLNESLGVFVEHRHRLIGATVGMFAIALTIVAWLNDRRGGLPWLASLALGFIIVQGVLGGHRVMLNSMGIGRELAVCHGLFAQICFVTLVALCLVASKGWMSSISRPHHLGKLLQTALTCAWVFLPLQMAFGAVQRHLGFGFVVHLSLAGAWLLFVMWLTFVIYLDEQLKKSFRMWPATLVALTVIQLGLGLGALWATQLQAPGVGQAPSAFQALLPTLHLAVGSLIFATTTVLALLAHRRLDAVPATAAAEGYVMEGTP